MSIPKGDRNCEVHLLKKKHLYVIDVLFNMYVQGSYCRMVSGLHVAANISRLGFVKLESFSDSLANQEKSARANQEWS